MFCAALSKRDAKLERLARKKLKEARVSVVDCIDPEMEVRFSVRIPKTDVSLEQEIFQRAKESRIRPKTPEKFQIELTAAASADDRSAELLRDPAIRAKLLSAGAELLARNAAKPGAITV